MWTTSSLLHFTRVNVLGFVMRYSIPFTWIQYRSTQQHYRRIRVGSTSLAGCLWQIHQHPWPCGLFWDVQWRLGDYNKEKDTKHWPIGTGKRRNRWGMDKRRYDIHMWSGSDIIALLIALVWVTRLHYYNTLKLLYSHWHRDSTHLEMAHYNVVFHGSTVNSVQGDFHWHIHNKDSESGGH